MATEGSSSIKIGDIHGLYIWKIPVFEDKRGKLFKAFVGSTDGSFPVDFNTYEHFFTQSNKNVFRGMHYQSQPHAARKIISIVKGSAIVFLLDARIDSPTYGFLQKINFTDEDPLSIYIPTGVSLGYFILEEETIISYRMDVPFCGNCDAGIDPAIISEYLSIDLVDTIRSERDLHLQPFYGGEHKSNCGGL